MFGFYPNSNQAELLINIHQGYAHTLELPFDISGGATSSCSWSGFGLGDFVVSFSPGGGDSPPPSSVTGASSWTGASVSFGAASTSAIAYSRQQRPRSLFVQHELTNNNGARH